MNKDDFINEIYFSKEEIDHYEKKFNYHKNLQLFIRTKSLTSNKISHNRIQDVVNSINSVKWIQVEKVNMKLKYYKNILNKIEN